MIKTILYVHDQQDRPEPIKQFLEHVGYRVELAPSGERAMELVAQNVPQLVLIDVLVEGRNGFEVCRQLRKHFTSDQVPVILSSSVYRSRIYREEAMAVGAQLYLLKPVKPDDLLSAIRETIDAKAPLPSSAPRAAAR